jgi:hypothetical protein
MLNLLEKIQYGLSGLVVLGALTLYIIWPPEYRPLDTLPDVRITQRPLAPLRPKAPGAVLSKEAKPEIPQADQEVLDRLAKLQNVRVPAGKPLEHHDAVVDKQTLDYVKREPNWTPELKKAKSQLLAGADGRNTRIKLFDIEDGSLFKKFGIQEGDIVEFIDGEQIDFESGAVEHIQRSKRLMEKLENGGKLPITVTGGGKPIQLEFKLE